MNAHKEALGSLLARCINITLARKLELLFCLYSELAPLLGCAAQEKRRRVQWTVTIKQADKRTYIKNSAVKLEGEGVGSPLFYFSTHFPFFTYFSTLLLSAACLCRLSAFPSTLLLK